ncbi:LAMI_0B07602g1_1 [Lachancea mirantina]|uniref:LAMI_0B07602g1_1 n=1 Tax=Lachancea mirantina TaxID=1230905 RepID=A0A1G4IXX3_9SACH|nr:LAMI_0B07602g1_1 [Lachancea mirantina]
MNRILCWMAALLLLTENATAIHHEHRSAITLMRRNNLPSLKTVTTTTSASPTSLNDSSTTALSGSAVSGSNTTTMTTSASSSSSSSYIPTFTPIIPSNDNNKKLIRAPQPNGTVFIAVGSSLGFLALACGLAWAVLACKSWRSACKEQQMQALESKRQTDPFMFYTNDYVDSDSNSSRGSDVSERALKTRLSARPSIYSLGSTSTLNLLQKHAAVAGSATGPATVPTPSLNPNRASMFVSPTELMQNHTHARSAFTLGDSSAGSSAMNTPTLPINVVDAANAQKDRQPQQSFRPPSVHLEKLFDDDE